MENKFSYRAINPHDEEDIKKYLDIHEELNNYLKKKVNPLTEEQIKWLRIRMGATELLSEHQQNSEYALGLKQKPDEICFVCEKDNEVIGYIFINTYNVVNGERTNDNIGIISEIFVQEKHRTSGISFQLLKMAVDSLIKYGCLFALCNVQEDNKNRFLHFAMADGNVIETSTCKRKDGTTTIDYTLLIDLKNLQTITEKELGFKALKYRREQQQKNIKFC